MRSVDTSLRWYLRRQENRDHSLNDALLSWSGQPSTGWGQGLGRDDVTLDPRRKTWLCGTRSRIRSGIADSRFRAGQEIAHFEIARRIGLAGIERAGRVTLGLAVIKNGANRHAEIEAVGARNGHKSMALAEHA